MYSIEGKDPDFTKHRKGNRPTYNKKEYAKWQQLNPEEQQNYPKWMNMRREGEHLLTPEGKMIVWQDDIEDVLTDLYFNPKVGYLGTMKFYSIVDKYYSGITRDDVAHFLFKNETHAQHKRQPRETLKPLRPSAPNKIWQVDLIDMSSMASHNNRHNWCLTCIDLFTKYAWVQPMTTKHAPNSTAAIQAIFDKSDTHPSALQTDNGGEFKAEFDELLRELGISHVFTSAYLPQSNGQVENFNKTIKTMLSRYFTANNTKRWIDVIDSLCNSYNISRQTTTGKSPYDAWHNQTVEGNADVKRRINEKADRRIKNDMSLLLPGDTVRVALEQFKDFRKQHFRKSYQRQYSQTIYMIRNMVKPTNTAHRNTDYYRLDMLDGTPMKGMFARQRLLEAPEESDVVQAPKRVKPEFDDTGYEQLTEQELELAKLDKQAHEEHEYSQPVAHRTRAGTKKNKSAVAEKHDKAVAEMKAKKAEADAEADQPAPAEAEQAQPAPRRSARRAAPAQQAEADQPQPAAAKPAAKKKPKRQSAARAEAEQAQPAPRRSTRVAALKKVSYN